MKLRIIQRVF